MNEDGVARLHAVGTAQQVLRGHALQHHRCALLEAECLRQFHQPVGRDQAHLGVGADRPAGIRDAIAGLEILHLGADRLHHPRPFQADAGGQRQRIGAGTVVDVDKVQADGVMAHARLVRARIADGDLFPFQYFGAAGLVEADGVGHGYFLFIWKYVEVRLTETTLTGTEFQLSSGFVPARDVAIPNHRIRSVKVSRQDTARQWPGGVRCRPESAVLRLAPH